jgi:hypothetical protein
LQLLIPQKSLSGWKNGPLPDETRESTIVEQVRKKYRRFEGRKVIVPPDIFEKYAEDYDRLVR